MSWCLIVAERVLDGHRLNPPIARAVYFLGVVLARALHLPPEIVTIALVCALMAMSVGLTWRLLRDRPAASPLRSGHGVAGHPADV